MTEEESKKMVKTWIIGVVLLVGGFFLGFTASEALDTFGLWLTLAGIVCFVLVIYSKIKAYHRSKKSTPSTDTTTV